MRHDLKTCNRPLNPMRALLLALPMLFGAVPAAQAQLSVGVGISLPGVNIGINLPAYPQLVRVPGYPVYYAPSADNNYFFYDGLYWVYEDDNWYSSDWYNGPWHAVSPAYVPVYVLRVPVRYYSRPPQYFRHWRADAPPRWGDHWGRDWERRHSGWDRWNRNAMPAPAPLPVYQRHYSGDRYPHAADRQRELRARNYRYQPRELVSRQQYQRPVAPRTAVAPPPRNGRPDRDDSDRRDDRRADRRPDRPDRQAPPPPREMQRAQVQSDRGQGQGRPERVREQPAPVQHRAAPERVQRAPEQRGPQGGGPGRDANGGNRGGDGDRGRGGPPEGRGRDKDK